MPRYPVKPLPPDWQIARRESGYYLQEREPDGRWADRAGPYQQRGSAVKWWRRHYAADARPPPPAPPPAIRARNTFAARRIWRSL